MASQVGSHGGKGPLEPSEWVRRFAPLVPPGGTVLDLACGRGRHARFFLALGHPVVALDGDTVGVADVVGAPGLEVVQADLESGEPFPLGGRQFAGVVVTNYLHRPIMADIVRAVAPRGVLIYETFGRDHPAIGGRPRNPHFLLEPGELLEAVRGNLRVVVYEDVLLGTPPQAAVQRIAARREP